MNYWKPMTVEVCCAQPTFPQFCRALDELDAITWDRRSMYAELIARLAVDEIVDHHRMVQALTRSRRAHVIDVDAATKTLATNPDRWTDELSLLMTWKLQDAL